MILSHQHKFIFIAIPKTGTHSVRQALRPHLGELDEEQVQLFVQKQLKNERIAQKLHGHIKAQEIREALGENIWQDYFSFAFVRNPFDRFVSYCFFMNRNRDIFKENPLPYMKRIISYEPNRNKILFRPQYEFVTGIDGKSIVDYIGKVEHYQEHFSEICQRFGLPSETLSKVNSSSHGKYHEYYDEELKDMVVDYYQKDFEWFHYPKTLSHYAEQKG